MTGMENDRGWMNELEDYGIWDTIEENGCEWMKKWRRMVENEWKHEGGWLWMNENMKEEGCQWKKKHYEGWLWMDESMKEDRCEWMIENMKDHGCE